GMEAYAVGRYLVVSYALDVLKNPERTLALLCEPTRGFPYLDYQAGRLALYRGDYTAAIEKLTFFAQKCGGVYHADAWYKAGLAALCAGLNAEKYFRAAVAAAAVFDEDVYAQKQARIHLNSPPTPADVRLLKARLFFDGGYFQRALEELQELNVADEERLTELHYRKARIYHATGRYEHALFYYSAAQRLFPKRNLWMKVYSGYHKGQIYEAMGRIEAARDEWRRCLEYDDYDYQNGLEQKVKAALGR
ncbi:MAG: tetratricopeptide repeat protein, partial [Bacteroidia bacterium]|nr:tetratricopeptide repeat protein [Bacteroidia bacterium]